MVELLAALAFITLAVYLIGAILSLKRVSPAPSTFRMSSYPPVSMIKPIKGTEEQLELNLRSFLEQDYPGEYEIVFSSTDPDDPGMSVAKCVSTEYPHVRSRFVVADFNRAANPKVANILAALSMARHDIVLLTDANTRAEADYLCKMIREYSEAGSGLLSSYVVGVGERSCGAAMENMHLTAFVLPTQCFTETVAGVPCVIGKSMLFRQGEIRQIGGFELVKDTLAEDYWLGRRYEACGLPIILSGKTRIYNVNCQRSVKAFVARHSRWLKMNAAIHPVAFSARTIVNPVLWAFLLLLCARGAVYWSALAGLVILLKGCGDHLVMRRIRGRSMRVRYIVLSPLKDLLIGAISLYAAFSRRVVWRGRTFRLRRGSCVKVPDGNAVNIDSQITTGLRHREEDMREAGVL